MTLVTNFDWVARSRSLDLQVHNFVDGRRETTTGGKTLEKYSPRDGRLLCRFHAGALPVADRAVRAARSAFEDGRWSNMSLAARKKILYKLASLIDDNRNEFALLESLDVGKPIRAARDFDVPTAAALVRFNAESADKLLSKVYASDPTNHSYQLRRPFGVIAAIIGWNFPLVLAAGKLAPVLATGNSLVLKPSEITSLSATRLAELAQEAGVPDGVLNVVNGDSTVGDALARHADVDLITFTGSTQTGKKLLVAAGQSNMKRVILECGGKAPSIVFEDGPDLESIASAIVERAFWNQGEVCTASSRVLVQDSVKAELLELVIKKTTALIPGDPLDPATNFGAVVSRDHECKIRGYIETGKLEGATAVYQSTAQAPVEGGFYVPPVIFDDVYPEHKIAREEIFGPVLSVLTFSTEKEAIRIANDTSYGLSAVLWTRDLGRAHRLTRRLNVGWVVVNATGKPSGGLPEGVLSVGGQKESGIGVEGGVEGMESYMTQTAVQIFV